MSNLTTIVRFKQYAAITDTGQDALITAIISQASSQIERYLRRNLTTTSYKAWYDGLGSPQLRLLQYPITALNYVSCFSNDVARISSTALIATVSFDGTNVVLTEVSQAGIETQTLLPVTTYPTVDLMVAAIGACSTGTWTAVTDYPASLVKPCSMLRPIYGQNAAASGGATLTVPGDPIQCKILSEDQIEIIDSEMFPNWDIFPNTESYPNRMASLQPGMVPPTFSYGFPPGSKNIFVWFTAGYTMPVDASVGPPAVVASDGTIPPGLELVTQQIIQDILLSTDLNTNVKTEHMGSWSRSINEVRHSGTMSLAIGSAIENRKRDLNQYRRVSLQ